MWITALLIIICLIYFKFLMTVIWRAAVLFVVFIVCLKLFIHFAPLV